MVKVIVSFVVGAAACYFVMTHPTETHKAVSQATDTALNGAQTALNSAKTAHSSK